MNVNVFVDMDGVIAKYNPNTPKLMYDENFFLTRPAQSEMIDAVKMMIEQCLNIYILSSVIDSPYCVSEKNLWLDRHLPEINYNNRIYVPYGISKSTYIENKVDLDDSINILIDDHTKNIVEWVVPNALPIKFINEINDKSGYWAANNGYNVGVQKNAEEIVSYIDKLIKNISKKVG